MINGEFWTRQQMLLHYLFEMRARDRDRSGEAGETRSGSTEGKSPGPKGIAQTPSSQDSTP